MIFIKFYSLYSVFISNWLILLGKHKVTILEDRSLTTATTKASACSALSKEKLKIKYNLEGKQITTF